MRWCVVVDYLNGAGVKNGEVAEDGGGRRMAEEEVRFKLGLLQEGEEVVVETRG